MCLSNEVTVRPPWCSSTVIAPPLSTLVVMRNGWLLSMSRPFPYLFICAGSAIGPPTRAKQPFLSHAPEPKIPDLAYVCVGNQPRSAASDKAVKDAADAVTTAAATKEAEAPAPEPKAPESEPVFEECPIEEPKAAEPDLFGPQTMCGDRLTPMMMARVHAPEI